MRKKYFAWVYGVANKPGPQIWWDEVDMTYASVRNSVMVSMELKGDDIGLSLNELAAKFPVPVMAER